LRATLTSLQIIDAAKTAQGVQYILITVRPGRVDATAHRLT
jgi:hypothetical protein